MSLLAHIGFLLGLLLRLCGYTLLAGGLGVASWASWQFRGFRRRRQPNGESHWGLIFYAWAMFYAAAMAGGSILLLFLARLLHV